jgi:hypothetical protein
MESEGVPDGSTGSNSTSGFGEHEERGEHGEQGENGEQGEHGERGEHGESCEHCHDEFKYECNDLEWVNYLLDEAPAEDGFYMGDSSPGVPAYACYGIFESALGTTIGTGRIQITEPKGMFSHRAPGYFSNDSSRLFYLKNDCKKYHFEWVVSGLSETVLYGVEPLRPKANGFPDYIGRKKISDQKTVFGAGRPGKATLFYVDDTKEYPNQLGTSDVYEVLTCKSKSCEFNQE